MTKGDKFLEFAKQVGSPPISAMAVGDGSPPMRICSLQDFDTYIGQNDPRRQAVSDLFMYGGVVELILTRRNPR